MPPNRLLSSGKFHITQISPSKDKYVLLKRFKCSQSSSGRMSHTLALPCPFSDHMSGRHSSWGSSPELGISILRSVWCSSPQFRGHYGRLTLPDAYPSEEAWSSAAHRKDPASELFTRQHVSIILSLLHSPTQRVFHYQQDQRKDRGRTPEALSSRDGVWISAIIEQRIPA